METDELNEYFKMKDSTKMDKESETLQFPSFLSPDRLLL